MIKDFTGRLDTVTVELTDTMDVAKMLFRRQLNTDNNDNDDDDGNDVDDGVWWYSPSAYAIKWAVIAGILVAFFLFFILGYLHARRRMRKGLPPLAYHRWLVPRQQRMAFAQRYPQHAHHLSYYPAQQAPYGHGPAYAMGAYGPPPPAYHEPEYVPAYTPEAPKGPNKVDPDQNYVPPTGPPPTTAELAVPSPAGGPSQPPRAASRY